MQYVLKALGAFKPEKLDEIANSLYQRYHYDVPNFRIELVAFGKKTSKDFGDPTRPPNTVRV
jgi:hypothetical protein